MIESHEESALSVTTPKPKPLFVDTYSDIVDNESVIVSKDSDLTPQNHEPSASMEDDKCSISPQRQLLTTLIEEIIDPDDLYFKFNEKSLISDAESIGWVDGDDSDEQETQSNEDFQENINSSFLKDVNSSNEIKHDQLLMGSGRNERTGSTDRFSKHPVYNNKTRTKVDSSKVRTTIEANFSHPIRNQERLFICKIKHNCLRSFTQQTCIEDHIFSFFFFVKCPNCAKKFTRLTSLYNHSKICRNKSQSKDLVSRRKQLTDEFDGKRSSSVCSSDISNGRSLNSFPVIEIVRLPDYLVDLWR